MSRRREALAVLFTLLCGPASAQFLSPRLDVAGSAYCRVTKNEPEGPATNLRVHAQTQAAAATAVSEQSGYYRLPLRYRETVDRNLRLIYFSGGQQLKEQTFFVAREKVDTKSDIPVATVATIIVEAPDCQNLDPTELTIGAVGGSPSAWKDVLAILGAALAGAGFGIEAPATAALPVTDRVEVSYLTIDSQSPTNTNIGGRLLADSRSSHFGTPGFRYAPARRVAETVITNPSGAAMEDGWQVLSSKRLGAKKPTNWHLAASFSNGKGFGAGVGFFRQTDKEKTAVVYDKGRRLEEGVSSSDQALTGFLAKRFGSRFSASISARVLSQSTEVPDRIRRMTTLRNNSIVSVADFLETRKTTTKSPDLGVGLTFQASPSLRVGAAVQNLLASEEHVAGNPEGDRVLGAGAVWFRGRLHLGADIEWGGLSGTNGSLGASFQAPHNFEFGLGYLSATRSLSGSIRFRGTQYTLRRSDGGSVSHYLGSVMRF